MQPGPQPFLRAQQPLAGHWQAFVAAPALRLSRWLTTAADRPLLHDYLLGLCAGPGAPLRPLAAPENGLAGPASSPVCWLTQLTPDTEATLRVHLAGRHPQRFIVLEDCAAQPLRRLARWFPAAVHTVAPAGLMPQLLAELAAAAPADQPEGRFQRQFAALTAAIGRADGPAVAAHTTACLATCRTLGWPLAEATVWLSGAHYFLAQQRPDEAQQHFAAALACSEAAFCAGNPAAGGLSIQAWLGEAATWQQRRRARRAIPALQQAVDRAQQVGENLLGTEAARQLGLAFDQAGYPREVLGSYQLALAFAERLPAAQRPRATLQALGEAYLKRLVTDPERQALRQRLRQLSA